MVLQVSYIEWLAALADWREVQGSSNWDSWVDQVRTHKGISNLLGSPQHCCWLKNSSPWCSLIILQMVWCQILMMIFVLFITEVDTECASQRTFPHLLSQSNMSRALAREGLQI